MVVSANSTELASLKLDTPMLTETHSGHDIIVIGASAGGVEALINLARSLPLGLPAAAFVVLHMPAQSPSLLTDILNRSGPWRAVPATDGATIEYEHIYVAVPDHHLLVERDRVRVVHGPKENRHRPAIDPLFRSAALAYGPRVVGVILTGSLDDGTAGLLAVKRRKGVAIVQDPRDALYPGMPLSALDKVAVDYCVPLASIGPLLVRLVYEPVVADEGATPAAWQERGQESSIMVMEPLASEEHIGTPSTLSCPECGGALWELQDGQLLRFRCRVGHAFSSESMFAEQAEAVEKALWVALKTLEESRHLSEWLASQARERGQGWLAQRFTQRAQDVAEHTALIRQVLMRNRPMSADGEAMAGREMGSNE
jgi:two-component system chemotaxis response regulator CheB